MPIGAEPQPGGGVHFRVWAPLPDTIVLVVDGIAHELAAEDGGYRSAFVTDARVGSRYGFRLDGHETPLPDPASRSQPDGPHGLSCVVDPSAYRWRDEAWRGVRGGDPHVITEIHIGTFTAEGTYAAASAKLPLLKEVGITVIELMPVAEFPGRFGWGYDGVDLFAPTRLYGTPDDLRAFVDTAHGLGLGVIMDVVYNHFGPDANYLPCFSKTYLTGRYDNEWGDAINFDGPGAAPVREFVRENAAYWVREFHLDGLRLDATQQIFDASEISIVAELTAAARTAAGGRSVLVVAENERQEARLVRPREQGGDGLDGVWHEDLHHTAHVALTGRAEAYYSDYTGSARELLACVKHGFLYQGQRSTWQKKPRGMPSLDLPSHQRITFLENHDQVANSAFGRRMVDLADVARLRVLTALLLLGPGTPMLFQGQEFFSSTPFLYFADHKPDLAAAVQTGRRAFLMQFPSVAAVETDRPGAPETFEKSRLDWAERDRNAQALALHRDLITLRRADPGLSTYERLDGAVLSDDAFLVRFFCGGAVASADRLLIVNVGREVAPRIVPEPLLAPPPGRDWRMLWSSEDAAYGGDGARSPLAADGAWVFPGRTAVLMEAVPVVDRA
ncbi:malto-oligosyltrehalose trehalohydrolase [Rhodoplanes sp. TEM]|uniref:Malto-oligosyltrehalose trehalohydrolase n=2 Tax=Rhodoplanes tepidamans TaxID=200616 RepID=A0ABT5J4Z9_RHOTP|nr:MULTISPECIES: malto-oligosyltrehalose trehalohydrolase [Rhodoplanes]MDC7784691.1 malto-oligosyltrehalose trehalohydrolase [Rhodoplanes tepidamans]MDC7982158.1 malto-oligosyltrehalose trehalohydrolase [Rhodoplanes sp. TEM]